MSEDDGNPNKVFLGGLNYDSSEDSIKAHFEDNFGQVDASRRRDGWPHPSVTSAEAV